MVGGIPSESFTVQKSLKATAVLFLSGYVSEPSANGIVPDWRRDIL
jgi:hypothetical protein